jgi:hypothetical protein
MSQFNAVHRLPTSPESLYFPENARDVRSTTSHDFAEIRDIPFYNSSRKEGPPSLASRRSESSLRIGDDAPQILVDVPKRTR